MSQQKEKIEIDLYWNGFCPECALEGKQIRMKLNSWDFFECEESKLQIALSAPNVLATILKFRGNGKFRTTTNYADEQPRSEILCRQTLEDYPFTDKELFKSSDEIENYIVNEIK